MEKSNNQGSADNLAKITKYFFASPSKKLLVFAMLFAALLFPFAGNDIFSKTGYAIFLIVPAILASVLGWRVAEKAGGYFKPKHSYFIATISLFVVAATLAAVSVIEHFYDFQKWNSLDFLFIALAAVFMLQLLVFAAVGGISLYKAALPASLYVLFSAMILYTFKVVAVKTLGRFFALIFISFVLIWIFVKMTDAPFKRTLGISTFNLISLAVREYVDPATISANPFENAGREMKIPFQGLKFETKKSKFMFALPWLHPGPTESIGGKLPSLLSATSKKEFKESVFFHTYVDHSLNPIFTEKVAADLCKIAKTEKAYGKPSQKATKFVEVNKSGINVIAQKIGKTYFFVTSFAPQMTEDISPAVGQSLLNSFREKAIFVDGHNSFSEGDSVEPVMFGDERADRLILAIEFAKKRLDRERQRNFKIAVETSQKEFSAEGIRGISVVVFGINGQKTAIVSLDTNNSAPDFRERIRKSLKDAGFEISEVTTTDSHLGDLIIKKHGMVGQINPDILEREILALAKKAIENVESAKASYLFAEFKTRVFGEKLFNQLIAIGSSLIPFAKFVAISLFVAFLFAAYVLLQL